MEFETSLMQNISSPLEVLSNAAALIETKSCDDYRPNFSFNKKSANFITTTATTSKELPTKENKMKRSKDRRELAHSSSFKIKARSNSPVSDDSSIAEPCEQQSLLSGGVSPLATNSSMTRNSELLSTCNTNALSCYNTTYYSQRERERTYRGSPFHIPGINGNTIRRNSDPSFVNSELEEPLDMTNKKNRTPLECGESQSESHSESSNSPTNSLTHLFGKQMMRPSVITCASSLLKTQSSPQKCYNCSTSEPIAGHCYGNANNNNNEYKNGTDSDSNGVSCKRHRCEMGSGVSDAVIDEHFRRSLGKDYSEIFSNSSNHASINVDDHFAKALGETWIRLQKSRSDESAKSSNCHKNAQKHSLII